MKKIILLLVILAVVIGTAVVYDKLQNESMNTASAIGSKTREYLLPDLVIDDVQGLRLKDDKSEVNVDITADRKSATVAERGGYPASSERIVSVLKDLQDQKIATKQIVKKGAWTEIKVLPPGEGTEGIGTLVELKAPGGKPGRTFILGEQISIAGGRSSTPLSGGTQRFIRVPEDGETIWVVSNTFFDLEPKPESWLDKAFIDVQKLKEVTVTHPKAEDSWKVTRPDADSQTFSLADAKAGEGLDSSKLTVSTLLSSPTFNDVLPKDKVGDTMKDAAKAKLTTFDGFTYEVQVAKQSKDGSDKYFMTVAVSADIPKARTPGKDEKEEDKKKKDEEFAASKKTQEEKLEKEKKFAGWVYEVSEYTVNNLLKKRPEIVKVTAQAEPAPGAAPAAAPAPPRFSPPPAPFPNPAANPAPPVSVTTPPVPVPPTPKVEVKPTPNPNANPATGEAPPPAAPPPAEEKK